MSDTLGFELNTGSELPLLQPVTLAPRYLGTITALMFVEERGHDKLTVTRHPVQRSADITDHAFMEPAELSLKAMATNSSKLAKGTGDAYVANLYQQVRALQSQRRKMAIQTGKRLYQNMLITSVELSNDEKSENALMLQITAQEIITVDVTVVSVPSTDLQADPAKTAGVVETGQKQVIPTTTVPAISLEQPLSPEKFLNLPPQ